MRAINILIKGLAGLLINFRCGNVIFSCFIFLALPTLADTIEAKLPSGITAYAEFRQGNPSKPAVLSLHGFLQTHHSQPMNALASNLAAAGYTVLSPTISLGINRRKQSMACEAVHTHTMDDEAGEIAFWADWLSSKGYKNIVPVGFSSTGNISLLQYNIQGSLPSIKKILLISMNPVNINQAEYLRVKADSKSGITKQNRKISRYSVGYCKNNFSATLNTYLSYSQFNDDKILELISQANVPLEILLGSSDTILPADWPGKISSRNARARVSIIEKGNHFFDGTTELDLTDKVESILKASALH